MQIFFSATTRGFYPEELQDVYKAAGTWPEDGVPVDDEAQAILRAAIAEGSEIVAGEHGWEVKAKLFDPSTAAPLVAFRQYRDAALNRMSGIGFGALVSGDTARGASINHTRLALLALPARPGVSAAVDAVAMEEAINSELAGIIQAADPEVAASLAVGAGGGQTRPT